jgi:hypothetical protein
MVRYTRLAPIELTVQKSRFTALARRKTSVLSLDTAAGKGRKATRTHQPRIHVPEIEIQSLLSQEHTSHVPAGPSVFRHRLLERPLAA